MRTVQLVAVSLLSSLAGPLLADVHLAKIFSDHMVVQQELPIHVWGRADADESVSVTFNGRTVTSKAAENGEWRVELAAMKADGRSHELVVKGKNEIVLKDVLLGEVWLGSGQSNMGRPVTEKAIEAANHPELRLFHVGGKTPRKGDLDVTLGWLVCTPDALRTSGDGQPGERRPFSEVAYHFARRLHEMLGVPVGIIQSNTGGSTARDWTPLAEGSTKFPYDTEIERLKHNPGACYRVKLRGLMPFAIRGVAWYQGEDDGRNRSYAEDLTKMIAAWRAGWERDDLPFYMAQIAQTTYASGMLGVWEAQVKVMQTVEHTGLAPSNTLQDRRKRPDPGDPRRNVAGTGWPIVSGSNPHPPNKHVVAARLADIALAKTYGVLDREVFGPTYASHRVQGDRIVVKFSHAGTGLKTDDGEPLNWFEISDGTSVSDRPRSPIIYVTAHAEITGKDTVEVWSPGIRAPKYVRFAWHALARHNLTNGSDLPAIPFRTDMLPQMWNRRPGIPGSEAKPRFYDPVEKEIEGWTVAVDPQLLSKEHAETGAKAFEALANHLQRIKYIVSDERLAQLQKLRIWIELNNPVLGNMQYHPSRGWLVANGHDPRLAKHVHIPRAKRLYDRRMWAKHPYVVLHELAHSYHDQVLSFDQPDIVAAFNAAKKQGIYDKVLLFTGAKVRHYALSNHKEYFAESTEAYFGVNDFYPFVRAELKEHDPTMFSLMEKFWGRVP